MASLSREDAAAMHRAAESASLDEDAGDEVILNAEAEKEARRESVIVDKSNPHTGDVLKKVAGELKDVNADRRPGFGHAGKQVGRVKLHQSLTQQHSASRAPPAQNRSWRENTQ